MNKKISGPLGVTIELEVQRAAKILHIYACKHENGDCQFTMELFFCWHDVIVFLSFVHEKTQSGKKSNTIEQPLPAAQAGAPQQTHSSAPRVRFKRKKVRNIIDMLQV